jgi:zinc finger BED domain-containing protein 1 (E3 SUMO-protein ligase ZBED1)
MAEKTVLNGKFIFKTSDTVVCKYCKKEFKYHRSNSSLNYHLRTKHAFVAHDEPSTSAASSTRVVSAPRQTTLVELSEMARPVDSAKYNNITNALARWVAENNRPINIVTDDGLEDVIRIASGNQSYTLPSRSVISSRIDDLYEQQRNKISVVLAAVEYVALTGDYWSSVANDSYLGVTCHFIDKDWAFHSFALCVQHVEERHYSENCAEHFSTVARSWNVYEKVTTFGTDNARNMTAALGMLPFQSMPCAAHSLQLSVNKAVAESGVDGLLAKCRKIVGHFKHSPANYVELKTQQIILSQRCEILTQDVPTRWNSSLHMIQRLLKNKEAVLKTLEQPGHKHNLTLPTEREWEKLRFIEKVLNPCRYATELLGGDQYVSSSMILPTLCHLELEMAVHDDDPASIVRFKTAFIADLQQRKQNFNMSWLRIATALDPRFKYLKCLQKDKRDEVWQELKVLLENSDQRADLQHTVEEPSQKKMRLHELSSDSEDEPLMSCSSSTKSVVERYRLVQQIEKDLDPLQWWKLQEDKYPALAKLARKYLGSPATTVPCERLFSVSGYVVNKKRASLEPANVNKLVCLSNWLNH